MAELGFDASVLQALGSLEEATRVLAAVPTGPYEPTTLGLGDFATQALPVRLVAPPAIPPEAAELFPTTRYFRNGIALRLELRVIADAVTWDTHEAAHAALTALAAHVHIDAELEGLDGRALPDRLAGKAVVLWTAVADPERRCVRIDVNVGKSEHLSPQALRGCAVRILGASLANAAVAVAPDNPTGSAALPLTFPVVDGLRPGWSVKVGLSSMFASAAVSPEGLLFVPPKGSNRVNVFNAAGAALPPLELPEFAGALRSKLSDSIAIAVDDTAGVVVLGDHAGSSTRVVALNPRTGALLWSTSPGEVVDCRGLAALPRHGVVVVSSNMRKELRVYHIANGALLATAAARSYVNFVAADPASGAVFVNVHHVLWSFSWDGERLTDGQSLAVESLPRAWHPLAVMSPACTGGRSELVIATWNTRGLVVLDLATRAVLRRHVLPPSLAVHALAADPHGTALVVVSASGGVHVLPWPLEGEAAREAEAEELPGSEGSPTSTGSASGAASGSGD